MDNVIKYKQKDYTKLHNKLRELKRVEERAKLYKEHVKKCLSVNMCPECAEDLPELGKNEENFMNEIKCKCGFSEYVRNPNYRSSFSDNG